MKTQRELHIWNGDHYTEYEDAERDGAIYSTQLSAGVTTADVRDLIELCGIVQNGDPAHFKAEIHTVTVDRQPI